MKKIAMIIYAVVMITCMSFTLNTYAAEIKELELANYLDIYIRGVAASPNGDMLLIHGGGGGEVSLFNLATGVDKQLEIRSREYIKYRPLSMCFSPDGSLCAIILDHEIHIYDSKSGELLNTLYNPGNSYSSSIAFNLNNNLIAGTSGGTYIIDIKTGDILLEIGGKSSGLRQNPIRNEVASINSGHINIYNSEAGGSLRAIQFDDGAHVILDMSYSPNGKYIAVSSYEKTIIYDTENGYNIVSELPVYGSVSFNKKSDLLVIGNKVFTSDDSFNECYAIKEKNVKDDTDLWGDTEDEYEYSWKYTQGELTILTADEKYFIVYGDNYDGIRILDASNISVRMKELQLEPSYIELLAGEAVELKLTGIYSNGTTEVLDLQKAKCVISDFSIAKIDEDLKLSGLSVGSTNLGITYNGISLNKEINVVTKKLKSINLESESIMLSKGKEVELKLIGTYTDGTTEVIDLQKTKYSIDNPSIATVDEKSRLIGLDIGTSTIDISYKGISYKKEFNIMPEVRAALQINNKFMYIDGEMKEIDPGRDTAPIINEGRTLLPIRVLIEQLGGTVDWVGAERKIIISLDEKSIEMWLDDNTAYVNDVAKVMDVSPMLINERTMIPVRFVSESLGINVEWISATQIIYIY